VAKSRVLAKAKTDPKSKEESIEPKPMYDDPSRTLAPKRRKTGNLAVTVTSAKIGVVKQRSGKVFPRQGLILTLEFKKLLGVALSVQGMVELDAALCISPNGQTISRVPSDPNDPFEGVLGDTRISGEDSVTDTLVFEQPELKKDLELDLVPGRARGYVSDQDRRQLGAKADHRRLTAICDDVSEHASLPASPGGRLCGQPGSELQAASATGRFLGGDLSGAPASPAPEATVQRSVENTARKKAAKDKEEPRAPGSLMAGDNVVIHTDAPGGGFWAGKTEADVKALTEADDFEKKALAERKSLAGSPRTKLATEGRIRRYSNDAKARVLKVTDDAVSVEFAVGTDRGSRGWVKRDLVKAILAK